MTTKWRKCLPPSATDIEILARSAISGLPDPFRQAAVAVTLRVAEWPDQDMLAELDMDNGFELTGLYVGIPLTEKSVLDQELAPDIIWLFRRPIIDEWAERGHIELGQLVAHIVIHEIAHHFGWSDNDIAQIDEWWK